MNTTRWSFCATFASKARLLVFVHIAILQTLTAQAPQGLVQQLRYFSGWSEFGVSVAISGDTAVVGSPDESNGNASESGAAYIFVRRGNTWTQQARLTASNVGAFDRFGYAVAISGNTVVVGAYAESSDATGVNGSQFNNNAIQSGAAYVFIRSGTTWTQQAYLKASNSRGPDDTFSGGWFGISVAISGDIVVVGATGEDSNATGANGNQANLGASNSGAAYVFVRNGTTWAQQAYLKASNTGAGDRFGNSVAVSADTIMVGAPDEDSNATGVNGDQSNNTASGSGAAYVFVRSGNTWSQQAYLKASNTGRDDGFGKVTISGDTAVVGSLFEDSSDTRVNGDQNNNAAGNSGAAYVFVRSGNTWSQQAYLKASNTRADDRFSISVAVSGDTVVVGAIFEDSNTTGVHDTADANSGLAFDSGAAYVFARRGGTWTQQAYLKASDTGPSARFGVSVAISGEAIVVGASGDANSSRGRTAYVFATPLLDTPPVLPENSVLNSASFTLFGQPGYASAPGSIASVFGSNFSTALVTSEGSPLPKTLAGVQVAFNGIPAPIFFVSPTQINVQLPTGLTGNSAQVKITTPGGESATRTVQTSPTSPAIFTFNQRGSGQGIIVVAGTATLVAPSGLTSDSRPAIAGDILTIYANGLGGVNPPVADGQNSCDPSGICATDFSNLVLRNVTVRPIVEIGGVVVPDAAIAFAGLAPQFVGLYQINLTLPAGVPTGAAVPIVIRQGTASSRADVTIAIQ